MAELAFSESVLSTDRAQTNRYYMLLLIALVSAVQIGDRMLVSLVVEPMKREMHLSDAQLGLIGGSAFGLAYALAAIPIGALADRTGRKNIVAASLAFWSLVTALTGFARSFLSLATARLLVGAGEAGAGPAMFSLIAARFPPELRSGAVGFVTAAGALATFGALWGGGVVVDQYGWRSLFFMFGFPGLLLAALFWSTVKEPQRVIEDGAALPRLTLRQLTRVFARVPMINLFLATVWSGLAAAAVLTWGPAYLARTYSMQIADIGFWLGLTGAVAGIAGSLAGGVLASYLDTKRAQAGLWLALVAVAINMPVAIALFSVQLKYLTLSLLVVWGLLSGLPTAPMAAEMLQLMPKRSQSTAIAIWSTAALGASSLGGVAVGALSDYASHHGSENGLRLALIVAASLGALAVLHIWIVIRHRKPLDPRLNDILKK